MGSTYGIQQWIPKKFNNFQREINVAKSRTQALMSMNFNTKKLFLIKKIRIKKKLTQNIISEKIILKSISSTVSKPASTQRF